MRWLAVLLRSTPLVVCPPRDTTYGATPLLLDAGDCISQ